MKLSIVNVFLAGWLAGCGSPTRPSGLPAPEYQAPLVAPWPPVGSVAPPESAPEPSEHDSAPAAPQNGGGSGATLPAGTP